MVICIIKDSSLTKRFHPRFLLKRELFLSIFKCVMIFEIMFTQGFRKGKGNKCLSISCLLSLIIFFNPHSPEWNKSKPKLLEM